MLDLPSEVEYLDIGCGDGRSTLTVVKNLKPTGTVLGIDRQKTRLPADAADGSVGFIGSDVMDLPNRKFAKFATLLNVLPGLPNSGTALAVLKKACIVTRDFVYVSQVQFDVVPWLFRRGFKPYYADSAANRFQGTSLDYYRMARALLEEGLVADFAILESDRIRDSSDAAIHSLQSPADSGPYDTQLHRYKSSEVPFPEPLYKKLHILLCRKPNQLVPITKRMKALEATDNLLYSTAPL
jgi:hypothetical protein